MLNWVLDVLKEEGFETQLVEEAAKPVQGCISCFYCVKHQKCVHQDQISELMPAIAAAEALILGSPVYFADLTPWLKALIDRTGLVMLNSSNPLKRKPGAAVVVARRAGHVHTFDSINHFFGITEMFTVGSSYWNLGVGAPVGSVEADEEAKNTMVNLGRNMAWLLKKIAG
jgi:multimeric flavodoxin WrbA